MRLTVIFSLVMSATIGCGGSLAKFPVAKVTGTVMCAGETVGNVRVVFGPVASKGQMEAGRSGVAFADDEGAFVISTYGTNDGAVIGKSNVIVSPPSAEDFPDFKCKCETDARKVVQVVQVEAGGDNDFTIELPLKTKNSAPNLSPKQLREMKEEAEAQASEEAAEEAAAEL